MNEGHSQENQRPTTPEAMRKVAKERVRIKLGLFEIEGTLSHVLVGLIAVAAGAVLGWFITYQFQQPSFLIDHLKEANPNEPPIQLHVIGAYNKQKLPVNNQILMEPGEEVKIIVMAKEISGLLRWDHFPKDSGHLEYFGNEALFTAPDEPNSSVLMQVCEADPGANFQCHKGSQAQLVFSTEPTKPVNMP
jgi:hypothetical protein